MKFNPFAIYSRTPSFTQINIEKHFKKNFFKGNEYVVVWYGKIKNGSSRSHAKKEVEVFFINLTKINQDPHKNVTYQPCVMIPIEIIPKLPIGSIWIDGRCSEHFNMDKSVITLAEDNYSYIINYSQSKDGSKNYAFNPDNYPVHNIINDGNSLITLEQLDDQGNKQRIIIHPLQFFNAHYGASKEINRILLTYEWGDFTSHLPSKINNIRNLLNLNYRNYNCPKAVLIPEKCVKGDAVFIYHLRNDLDSLKTVKNLNSRVLRNLSVNGFSYLKVEPYHKQPIEILIKVLKLSHNTLLCTQIIGISMPQGEPIFYDVEKFSSTYKNDQTANAWQTVKPIYQSIETDDLILEDIKGSNNQNKVILREKILTIGEIREIAKNEGVDIIRILNRGRIIPLPEPLPDSYATGERIGLGGSVGELQAIIDMDYGFKSDSIETSVNHKQLAKLFMHAVALKSLSEFCDVQVDTYTFDKGFQGEKLITMTYANSYSAYPQTVSVLRIRIKNETYFIIDCEPIQSYSSSGIILSVNDEQKFLSDSNSLGIRALVYQVMQNYGRLPDRIAIQLTIAHFNHVSADTSNWIRNGIGNLNR